MVVMQVIGMGSINKAMQGTGIILQKGKEGDPPGSRQAFLRVGWEGRIKGSLLVGNTPGFGLLQVLGFNQGRTKGASRTLSIMADWSSAGRRGPGRRFEET
jgi:hypothetical protein